MAEGELLRAWDDPSWPVTAGVREGDRRYAEVGWHRNTRYVFVQLGEGSHVDAMAFTLREGAWLAAGMLRACVRIVWERVRRG